MTDLNIGLPELGLTFQQLLSSMRTVFSDISDNAEKLLEAFNLNLAVGNNLDNIGALFSVNRKSGESDIDFRARMILFLGDHDKRALAIGDITTLSQRIIGIPPLAVREYPDFNFIHHTGKTHPGVHIEYTVSDIETYLDEFKNFRDIIQLYKAVGVPFIIGPIEFLTEVYTSFYTEYLRVGIHFQPNEELYKFPIGRFDIAGAGFNQSVFEETVIALDHWGAQIPFISFTDLVTVYNDTFKAILKLLVTDLVTVYNDIFKAILNLKFSDPVTVYSDIFKAILKLLTTDSVNVYSDTFHAILKRLITESYSEVIREDLLLGLGLYEHIHSGMDAQRFDVSRFDSDRHLIIDTFSIKDITLPFTETVVAFITSEVISTDTKGYFAELIPFIDLVDIFKGIWTKDLGTERIGGFDVDKFDVSKFETTFQDFILLIVIKSFTELLSVYSDTIRLNPKGIFTELVSSIVDTPLIPSDMKVLLTELLNTLVDTLLNKIKAILTESPYAGTSGGTTNIVSAVPLKIGSGTVGPSGDVGVIGILGNIQVVMEEIYT